MNVRVAIAALDFRPSLRGRALATGRSYLLGIVHSDRNALVLDSVQRGVGREATRRGYEVVSHSVALEPRIDPVADVLAFARRARKPRAYVAFAVGVRGDAPRGR